MRRGALSDEKGSMPSGRDYRRASTIAQVLSVETRIQKQKCQVRARAATTPRRVGRRVRLRYP
jgi:hypothetical protein